MYTKIRIQLDNGRPIRVDGTFYHKGETVKLMDAVSPEVDWREVAAGQEAKARDRLKVGPSE